MPRHCSVAGCRSNYDAEEFVSTFSLPNDTKERELWVRKIPTDFSHVKSPVICIKHFREEDIIRKDCVVYKGEYREFPRKVPKLKDGAYPRIFPNLPTYLSVKNSSIRRLVDVEEENFQTAVQRSLDDFNKYVEERTIKTFNDILKFIDNSTDLQAKWFHINAETNLHLCFFKIENCVQILGNIVVERDFSFKVFVKETDVSSLTMIKRLANKLVDFKMLEELLSLVEQLVKNPDQKCEYEIAVSLLENCNENMDLPELSFLNEQLKLCNVPKNCRRYYNATLLFAASVYIHSTSTYNAMLRSGMLCVPSVRILQSIVGKYSLSSISLTSCVQYLKSKIKFVGDQERHVNVLLDEIYIEAQFSFKGNSVYGGASGNESQAAETAQVFMISSAFSSYKDVVCIIPVKNLKAQQLKEMIITVLKEIEITGFQVISLIADNNAVNRKCFELMSTHHILEPFIPHPLDNSRLLFFIFDCVHIMKCVRNNWINKKNGQILFPDFEDHSYIRKGNFKNFEILYDLEKQSLVKYGHVLTEKAIYPSTLQKQNVHLALKIFNEKNIGALNCISAEKPNLFHNVADTCMFLDVFCKWWKIVNCKSLFEGQRFNDQYRQAVKADSIFQIEFLKKMSSWLKNWRQTVSVRESLSAQTFQSVITTCDAFVKLLNYLFIQYKPNYVLLGKFQTDPLEARFGAYRQMSGGNYYVSYVQLLESERKLRFRNNLLLSGDIPLRSLQPKEVSDYRGHIDISNFQHVIVENFNLKTHVPDAILPILTYIGGYVAKKKFQKQKCSICSEWLQLEKQVHVDTEMFENKREFMYMYNLINELDRGRLILPTEIVVTCIGISWHIMNCIVETNEAFFVNFGQQFHLLFKLSNIILLKIDMYESDMSEKCECNVSLYDILCDLLSTCCKIMLNNYVKFKNEN